MQHLLQAFLPKQNLMVVWLNRTMIDLCQGFCYIKDIRVYIVIWIIYKNVATEITWLQKNMVALQNLAPSKNLAPPCPSENSAPSWKWGPPQVLKSSPQSHIFFTPPPLLQGGGGGGEGRGCILCNINTIFWTLFYHCNNDISSFFLQTQVLFKSNSYKNGVS